MARKCGSGNPLAEIRATRTILSCRRPGSGLQVMFEQGAPQIADGLRERAALVKEMTDMRVKGDEWGPRAV